MNGWHSAGREILWNIKAPGLMIIFFFITCVVFYLGIARKIEFVRRGQKDPNRFSLPIKRLQYALRAVFGQKKTLKKIVPGAAHLLIFYPFIILIFTTLVVAVDHDLGIPIFHGYFYSLLSFLADISGVFILTGTAMLIIQKCAVWEKGNLLSFEMTVTILFIFG